MTLSGWCSAAPGARPKCGQCRARICGCACHSDSTDLAQLQAFQDVRRVESDTRKDGPGGSLLEQRTEVPGPRPTLIGAPN